MKTYFHLISLFIISNFITLTKSDTTGVCPGEISISPLAKCETIQNFLNNADLEIKTENLIYLASNNEGKISTNNYELHILKLNDTKLQSHKMKKYKLYIPNSCLKHMEEHTAIKLDRNKGIVILVEGKNNLNKNNIPDQYFIIRHNSPGSTKKYINSKTFDLSFCSDDPILMEDKISINTLRYKEGDNTPIDIDTILYGRKFGIDLFDPYSDFLSDICFKFKSEKGTDVTLDSRLEDYYQNITFCDDKESSHYLAYNYSDKDKTFTYRCAFGFYKNNQEQSGYLDMIDTQLKSLVSASNIKVINCYKKFLNIKDIIKNYGGMICILVLLIQIICFLIFCFCGIKPIEEKLDNLWILGTSILKRLSIFVRTTEGEKLKDGQPKKLFNLWGTIRKIIQKKKLEREKLAKENSQTNLVINKNNNNNINNNNNPPKKRKSLQSHKLDQDGQNNLIITDVDNNDIVNDNNNNKKRKSMQSKKGLIKETKDNDLNNSDIDINKVNNDKNAHKKDKKQKSVRFDPKTADNTKKKEDKEKKEKDGDTDSDKKSQKTQIYEYENDELNELPLKKAIKYDKRGFCKYYWNILMFSHIILNVFFRHNDYNLFTVKLGLLFMTFPINLTFNIFFYTNKAIKVSYTNALDDISGFWKSIANSVYSSLLSSTLLILLKFICLTHNSVRQLRKFRDLTAAKTKSVCVLRCIKVRVVIYYILSFAFLIIFGYYILCFCAVFENTQIQLVKSTFTSWLISLIYPLIICLITSIFRALAFKCKNRILYAIKQMMQFL